MRTLEIVLLIVVILLPFLKRKILAQVAKKYVLLFLGGILAFHLVLEGYRWQMLPVYLLLVLVAWRIQAVDPTRPVRLTFGRIAGYFVLVVLMVLGTILPNVLPVFSLPAPHGPYAVGTDTLYVKTQRPEPITEDPNDQRELVYKIWYPSKAPVSQGRRDVYIDSGSRAGFATKYGLPPSALNYLDYVKPHAYTGIEVAPGPFPVLLFSHGYGSKATGYYALLTELASQGYLIINMNHTYESLGATFPDGRVAHFDYGYQQAISKDAMTTITPIQEAFRKGLSYEERHPIVRDAIQDYFEGDIQDRWVEDMQETLDLLEIWNREGPLKGRMDLSKIGVVGHSVGGGAAGNLAQKDTRIKAAANLDGIQWGSRIDSIYKLPYLYLSADWPAEHEDLNAHIYKNKSTEVFYEAKLLHSGHPNFMDIPFMIPVPSVAGTGDIDPNLGMEIITKTLTSFFDRHLKKLPEADPKKVSEQYELLQMTVYQGDSLQ